MSRSDASSGLPYPGALPDIERRAKRLQLYVALGALTLITMTIVGNTFVRGAAVGIAGFILLATTLWGLMIRRRARALMRQGLTPPPIPADHWDYVMAARDLEGIPYDFSDFAGSVLVLTFWSTKRRGFIREMSALEQLRVATSDLDVRFACVTVEDAATVRSFIDTHEVETALPICVLDGEFPQCFWHQELPSTFVVGRTGHIALQHGGAAAWNDDSVVTLVRGLAMTPEPDQG